MEPQRRARDPGGTQGREKTLRRREKGEPSEDNSSLIVNNDEDEVDDDLVDDDEVDDDDIDIDDDEQLAKKEAAKLLKDKEWHRTQRNFDPLQMEERVSTVMGIAVCYREHPVWNKHCQNRPNHSFDHWNSKSWTGAVDPRDVNLLN
jgi:hypothetical protein